ncbi:hypothetical protein L207DRAFT_632808 [Hyaloscypha variabilis F]|uniref:Uncharacterized protein n=1 Tax=Hyaloscypha variabilis (strain UAMH 11265 / GT02V1 / F) TaxID=1149755 RepID=A0A2J6RSA0_HYAVF|nr:hypothetical protein L207DRAFT_632808 [Hyaloscypha variabilis F]
MAAPLPHSTGAATGKKNDNKPVPGQAIGGVNTGNPGISQGTIVPVKFGKYFRRRGGAQNPVWGSRQVGKMYIDCTFRLSESRRGILGSDGMPGAVLYVDLQFKQPSEYRLSAAEVEITLLEVDQALSQIGKGKWKGMGKGKDRTGDGDENRPVSHLEVMEFGPTKLLGDPTRLDEKINIDINPKVAASGVYAEVGGWSKEKKVSSLRQWILHGHKLSIIEDSRGRETSSSSARTLVWTLEENKEDPQARQDAVVHAGFAFRHDGRPVCIKVRVDGTLKSLTSKIKSIFPPKVFKDKEQGTVRALMDPAQELDFLDQLEMEAKDLERKMRERNEDSEKLVVVSKREKKSKKGWEGEEDQSKKKEESREKEASKREEAIKKEESKKDERKKKEAKKREEDIKDGESTTTEADIDIIQNSDPNTNGTAKKTPEVIIPKLENPRDDDLGCNKNSDTQDPPKKKKPEKITNVPQDISSNLENDAHLVNGDSKPTEKQSKQTKSVEEYLLEATPDVSGPPDTRGSEIELEKPVEKRSIEVTEMESTTIIIASQNQQQGPLKNGTSSNTHLIVGSSILGFILLEALLFFSQKLFLAGFDFDGVFQELKQKYEFYAGKYL